MEEDQKIQGEPQPVPMKSQSPKGPVKAIVGILVLIIFIIAGFFIFKGTGTPKESPSPSPIIRGVTTEDEIQTPTPTPEAVDNSEVTIEIQNGTGTTGDAGYLKDVLKKLGYEKFELGNASSQDYVTTSVTYLKDLSKTVQDEITEKLKETYKEVDVKTSSTSKVDVLIVTGSKKGSTPKPTPAASPSSSPTAIPAPTPTGQ
ncbi:MAG: LytR C-terminal domain-containing protein [bacterium]|nr:LytR C-terminal domain-containing protein [bacterium]